MRPLGPTLAIVLCAALTGCGERETSGPDSGAQPTTAAPSKPSEAARQALQAALPAPYDTADVAHGRALFGICRSCHTVTLGGANMTGPNLHGMFGRPAASVAGYSYSTALMNSGLVWDPQRLDEWLANPRTFLPGNKMSFMGLRGPQDRVDMIAYLMVESSYTP